MRVANVEYFKNYCNTKLGTSYAWNSKQEINIYWVTMAAKKVYTDIHAPKPGCRCLLSSKFDLSENIGKIVADVSLVHSVVDYLTNLNKKCDNDCACPCAGSNSTCDVNTCNTCVENTCQTCNTCSTWSTCQNCTTKTCSYETCYTDRCNTCETCW
jgi:hypothetical protein